MSGKYDIPSITNAITGVALKDITLLIELLVSVGLVLITRHASVNPWLIRAVLIASNDEKYCKASTLLSSLGIIIKENIMNSVATIKTFILRLDLTQRKIANDIKIVSK